MKSSLPSNTNIPPLSPYGTLQGELFQYSSPFPSLVAFESSPPSLATVPPIPSKKCILLGGLSDGLLPTPYTKQLETACHDLGWSLVQPVISSSYLGFGNGSLDRDTEELCKLMRYLLHHRNAQQFAIVGHSTGCQNSIHFLKHGEQDLIFRTKVVALQAPVSDREGAMLEPNYAAHIDLARRLKQEGNENEMMPRDAFWAPITASRFLSLQDMGGEDDFFSSDLTDEELVERLGHVGTLCRNREDGEFGLRLLVAFSGEDEYVPAHIDKHLLLERLCWAMNHPSGHDKTNDNKGISQRDVATPLMLETGNHNLSEGEGDSLQFVEAVASFLDLTSPN